GNASKAGKRFLRTENPRPVAISARPWNRQRQHDEQGGDVRPQFLRPEKVKRPNKDQSQGDKLRFHCAYSITGKSRPDCPFGNWVQRLLRKLRDTESSKRSHYDEQIAFWKHQCGHSRSAKITRFVKRRAYCGLVEVLLAYKREKGHNRVSL